MKKILITLIMFFSISIFPHTVFSHEVSECTKDHDCHEGEFCEFPVGDCGKSETKGECKLVPEICTMNFQPVCGCDGKTYPNACAAQKEKISVSTNEECK